MHHVSLPSLVLYFMLKRKTWDFSRVLSVLLFVVALLCPPGPLPQFPLFAKPASGPVPNLHQHQRVWGAVWASSSFDKHFQVGKEYLLNEKYELAVKELNAALQLSPGNATVMVERGTAYMGLGNFDSAISDFTRAIKGSSNQYLAYNNRGVAYFRKREFAKSIEDLDRALAIDNNQPVAYLNLAGASLCQGTGLTSARKIDSWLKRTDWKDKYSCHAAILAAFGYRQGKDERAAQAVVAEALKRTNRLLWPYPVLKMLAGTIKDRGILLQEAEESDYDSTQAHCFIALDLISKGDSIKAQENLDWIVKHGIRNSVEYWIARGMKK